MSRVKMDLAYAILMSQCTEGTFLYTPASADKFRPGACGYFDDSGIWEDITDLCDREQLAHKHYKLPHDNLGTMLQAIKSSKWDPLSVERDEEKGTSSEEAIFWSSSHQHLCFQSARGVSEDNLDLVTRRRCNGKLTLLKTFLVGLNQRPLKEMAYPAGSC
ncbi:hypothetical protein GMOD_00007302 [Pyrenophora seminiperda CCB06]|uniref:Uncharacterized protein n=1 Tax=Pyrenophora seminiperda CCB06 TaxID=1302712 RepID=A0A3M7MCP5_9PLEO|nr:hypothetical protein GMOD_00007302 [Pyrenophora seminiperda CCB06]